MHHVKGKILAIFLDKFSSFQENDGVSQLETGSVVLSRVRGSVIDSHFHENNVMNCIVYVLGCQSQTSLLGSILFLE